MSFVEYGLYADKPLFCDYKYLLRHKKTYKLHGIKKRNGKNKIWNCENEILKGIAVML